MRVWVDIMDMGEVNKNDNILHVLPCWENLMGVFLNDYNYHLTLLECQNV